VGAEAATLAQAVESKVPPDHRIGLVDTGDASSIVGILATFIAGRPVALLPVSGANDPQMEAFASEARCRPSWSTAWSNAS